MREIEERGSEGREKKTERVERERRENRKFFFFNFKIILFNLI